ncbi:MAG: TonB-dependent receptor domain-containing protein [Thainema sp.]
MKQSFWAYSVWTAGAVALISAQSAQANPIAVTDIQLNPTAEGFDLVLETPSEQSLQAFTSQYGETLIVDVINAQLQLPDGPSFQQQNPVAGVETLQVTSLDANSIRITITGQAAVPTASVISRSQALVLQVSAPEPIAQEPSEPAPDPSTTPPPDIEFTPESPADPTQPDTTDPPSTIDPTPDPAEIPVAPESPETTEAAPIRIVVTATRTEEEEEDLGRSVTVITREELEQQSVLSRDLADILGTLVPGFGPPNQLRTTRGQTLRGREPAVLIDGVPLVTNFRVNRQELRSIDPSAIERIEVVRGPSAIFGGQSTGGVINIITRRPENQPVTLETQVGVSGSVGELEDDGFGNVLSAAISGRANQFDYRLSASREYTGSFFDAAGNRIVSEASLSDTTSYNILGKLGYDLTDSQRLDFTVNYFDSERETDFVADPRTLLIPGRQIARALEIEGLEREDNPSDRNLVLNLSYTNEDLFGSRLQGQIYYQDAVARGEFADGRLGGEFFPFLFQSRLDAERWGGRLQIETPLTSSETLNLLWGADYENQENQQITAQFDGDIFDAERRLAEVQEFNFTPPYTLDSLGLFARLEWEASSEWLLRGGLRYENISLSIDDYVSVTRQQPVEGGNRSFDDLVFDVGAVYSPTDNISFFGGVAQSFSVPEFSRIFRLPPPGFVSVEDDLEVTEPIKVTEYELGVRGDWPTVQASLSGFFNTSSLGASLVPNENGLLGLVRAPQRVYGLEATLDWQPTDRWGVGGILSWIEGENDVDEDGDYIALNSGEIQPLKLTAYVENETLPGWRNRLQALFVGGRDRAFDAGVDPVTIEDYVVVDFISSVDIGPGTLQVGVENLFDNQYFPVISQFLSGFDDRNYIGGRGRTIRLLYSASW